MTWRFGYHDTFEPVPTSTVLGLQSVRRQVPFRDGDVGRLRRGAAGSRADQSYSVVLESAPVDQCVRSSPQRHANLPMHYMRWRFASSKLNVECRRWRSCRRRRQGRRGEGEVACRVTTVIGRCQSHRRLRRTAAGAACESRLTEDRLLARRQSRKYAQPSSSAAGGEARGTQGESSDTEVVSTLISQKTRIQAWAAVTCFHYASSSTELHRGDCRVANTAVRHIPWRPHKSSPVFFLRMQTCRYSAQLCPPAAY